MPDENSAKAGILKKKRYTTSQTAQVYKEEKKPDPFPRETYEESRIVQDGNIITAQGHAFWYFAFKIWDWFKAYEYDGERKELEALFTQI